jgi:hypothetical protein
MSAVLAAVFTDHATAEAVRTRLVSDGFPTDRVELTSQTEPGQAGTAPGDRIDDKFANYFQTLFDEAEDRRYAASLTNSVLHGHAAVIVHPRGDIETTRAVEILEAASPMELHDKDLDKQTLEAAASETETPTPPARMLKKILTGH